MGNSRRQVGDLYRIFLGDRQIGHMQHVADDRTQLGSNVVRVFEGLTQEGSELLPADVVQLPVAFVAHVALPVGIKRGVWEKVGHVAVLGDVDILFCQANDYGQPGMKTSNNWSVWRTNQPMVRVGRLDHAHQKAELGLVVNPYDIVSRVRTGRYEFTYPSPA